jgi:hypothetical protein
LCFPHLFTGFLKYSPTLLVTVYVFGGHHQGLKTKNFAFTVLLALVLSTTFTFLNPTSAQTSDAQEQKAQKLLTILENNNMSITQALSRLDSQNVTANEAKTVYNEGLAHASQATNLLNEEKFSEACNEAVVAMQLFEETLRLIENASPVEPTEAEIVAEEAIILKANITRAMEHVERLEKLTQRAARAGYDTEAIDKKILAVKRYLEDIRVELSSGNLQYTVEQLHIVKKLLDDLNGYVDRLTANVTASNTEKYLNAAEVRVSEAKQNITLSATLTAASKEAAIAALNQSELSLSNARDKIDQDNMDEAIDELEEAKKWEEESTRAITADSVNSTSVTPTNEKDAPTKDSATTTNDTVTATNESSTRADATVSK